MDILATGRKQSQSWSTNNVPISYIKPMISCRTSNFNGRHNLMSWRPNLKYENVDITHSNAKLTSNDILDAPIIINSLKLPNLMTEYEHNPIRTPKIAFCTRYTPNEWFEKQVKYYNEADSCRHYSEKIRNDVLRIVRDAEEKVQSGQYNTGRRLGERINDINFWRNEIALELERLFQEMERLKDCRVSLEKSIKDTEGPLHIAEECLYYREARKGSELVHDDTEKCLLREIEMLNENRKKLEACLDKCKKQLQDCRASQCQLELNLKHKENALGIDTMCHQLNNYSHGLQYYTEIENHDSCFSEQNTWTDTTNRTIEKSLTERNKSCQLRAVAKTCMNKIAQEIWDVWNDTNNALANRSSELFEAKNKLQQHLQKVQQEIFDVEKNLELIHKAIADKSHVLKVAHTRLEARLHRPDIELCRDYVHTSLQKEIGGINHQIGRMYSALKELNTQYQRLLRTRVMLENDLALKIDAIHIDREKVYGVRRAYPINILFKL